MKQPLLVLTSTFPRWKDDSIPSFVYELSRRLAQNFDIHVLTPYAPGTSLYEIRNGLKIHRYRYWPGEKDLFAAQAIVPTLKMKPWLWLAVPFFFLSQVLHAVRLVKAHSIGVIHAHWIIPQGLTAVLCRLFTGRDLRILVTAHGTDVFGLNRLRLLKGWVLNRTSALTVASRAILARVREWGEFPALPAVVLPMGVDMDLFHPAKRDESVRREYSVSGHLLLFVGRLTQIKGLRYLLEAMPAIVHQYPDSRLLIIGDGEERHGLEQLAEALGLLDKHVVFIGALPHRELPRFMATADVFIGPSISVPSSGQEGFGLVFAEALASRCAVVTTDLPAIADIITDNVTGLIVPDKHPEALVKAVLLLLENSELRKTLGRDGRNQVSQRFDWGIITQKYLQILRS